MIRGLWQLRTFSRSFTPWILHKNSISTVCTVLEIELSTSMGRNGTKIDWKTRLCGLWKLPFCDHGTIKLTENCICFTNRCVNLHFLPSVTHEHHPEVLELLDLLHCRLFAACTGLGFWRKIIPRSFQRWFSLPLGHPQLETGTCWDPVQRMKAVPNRRQKSNGWSYRQKSNGWSSQQWHPRRLVCECLSNIIDYEEEWFHHTPLSESNTPREQLLFNSSDMNTNFWAEIQFLGLRSALQP